MDLRIEISGGMERGTIESPVYTCTIQLLPINPKWLMLSFFADKLENDPQRLSSLSSFAAGKTPEMFETDARDIEQILDDYPIG